jgi:hypothetical protein
MLRTLLLAGGLAAQIMAAPADLSPQTRPLIAPVHAAIVEIEARQARLPPPRDDAERIRRMTELDQAGRMAFGRIDMAAIPAAERKNAVAAVWQEILRIDHQNLATLMAMLPPEGWFTISRYGKDAARGAFLIVQHSDLEHWRRFTPVMERLARKGEVEGGQYALMYDRLALSEGRRQRYGSQLTCKAGKRVPEPIEDVDGLDKRRAELGMAPYADYLASFASDPPCSG